MTIVLNDAINFQSSTAKEIWSYMSSNI